ncbi:hypothetical protein [uncultured Cohaesibacter sp.]|uniref:hypothetical protein n=1 Tax=uncultured Cohaesibacter sp. TaxID=1002546 RepID=UPI0029C7E91A|nr:hypothetical protein [uncultured Cohaesibacter sp.]
MPQNHQDISQPTLLTPLERELMSSIEELVTQLNEPNKEQRKALRDTVNLLIKRQEALEASFKAFQTCQMAYNIALIGWAGAPNDQKSQVRLSQAIKALESLDQAASSE